jgi:hypothetical protein
MGVGAAVAHADWLTLDSIWVAPANYFTWNRMPDHLDPYDLGVHPSLMFLFYLFSFYFFIFFSSYALPLLFLQRLEPCSENVAICGDFRDEFILQRFNSIVKRFFHRSYRRRHREVGQKDYKKN